MAVLMGLSLDHHERATTDRRIAREPYVAAALRELVALDLIDAHAAKLSRNVGFALGNFTWVPRIAWRRLG